MPTLCPPGPKLAPKRARKTMIQIGKNPIKLAEREGFEPSVPVTQYARLAIWCLRPLGHLSARASARGDCSTSIASAQADRRVGWTRAAFQRMSLVGAPRNAIATRPSRDRYRSGINRSVIKSLAGVSYGLLR